MRYCNVGEVCIDDLYNLIIVIFQLLKLEVKVVQPSNKLHFGRIASDDNELFSEDAFDDNRLRLCSSPALQSNSLKRMFCTSLSRKEYL